MIQNTEERSTTGVTNSLSGDQWKYKIKGKSRIRFIKTDPGKEIQCSEDGFKIGKWQREEHLQFLKACEKHGNNWAKIQDELKTRSSAQIRSHAQKFIIKLCKKYQIKLRSKKFKKKSPKHLDYVNKCKNYTNISNFSEIDALERRLLDTFNYYNREYKPFVVEKYHRNHDECDCPLKKANNKVMDRLKNQIFIVKKVPKMSTKSNRCNQQTFDILTNCMAIERSNSEFLQRLDYFLNYNQMIFQNILNGNFDVENTKTLLNQFIENFFMNGYFNTTETRFYQFHFQQIKKTTQALLNELTSKQNYWMELFANMHRQDLNYSELSQSKLSTLPSPFLNIRDCQQRIMPFNDL